MKYAYKLEEVTNEAYKEMNETAESFDCGECGKRLTVHTNPAAGTLEVGCVDLVHKTWRRKETQLQRYRRAGELELPADIGRQMNRLAVRYPAAIVDRATAALFIIDCARLGLDPLMQPAEAVPVPFTIKGKKIVQMIVSVDGWLSMAARGCPELWSGPPTVEPVFDEQIAESLSGDPKAWLYRATGSTRGGQPNSIYGYFTPAEHAKAIENRTPAATNPGNQAAIRATKRWVRQNFPECRQHMLELTVEWRRRAEGIKEVEEYIDAEYTVLDEKEPVDKKKPEVLAAKSTKTVQKKDQTVLKKVEKKGEEKTEGKFRAEHGETGEVEGEAHAGNFHKEEMSLNTARASAEPEGFVIDPVWLKDALGELKWNDNTCKTFLVSQYKVSPTGTLEEVISRLTRVQAKEFVNEIQSRQSSKPRHLL